MMNDINIIIIKIISKLCELNKLLNVCQYNANHSYTT